MDAPANYPQRAIKAEPLLPRRPRRRSRHYALLSTLAAFGLIAFIFSAISPDDDNLQQEFFQSSKSKQCFLANHKALSNLQTFRMCIVSSALAPPTQQLASFYVTARVSVPEDEIKVRVCSSRTGDRSPPTKTS
jgi:hypothetical protein